MFNTKLFLFIIALGTFLSFQSCKNESNKSVVDHIDLKLNLQRTEIDFFAAKSKADFDKIRAKDSFFYDIYVDRIIGDISGGSYVSSEEKAANLLNYITHEDMLDLYGECKKKFGDFSEYMVELTEAFKHYKYYFPKRTIPSIYTMISPFRAAHPCLDSVLGVGLDMYLGADFGPYNSPMLEFPMYQIKKMRPDFLVPNAMKAWLLSEFDEPSDNSRFLDQIIYQGKILCALDALLPATNDSLLIGYFKGQLEYCESQEFQIWDNIIANKLLYSTDKFAYRGYLGDGPFSSGPGVPNDTPPKIGEWMGWQIVKAFMKKNEKVSFETLMQLPADFVLKESKYKP